MSHVFSSGKWGGICILELLRGGFLLFYFKTRLISRCSSHLNWSAEPLLLGQEEKKYVLKCKEMYHLLANTRTATLLSVFLTSCFSSFHPHGLLEGLAVIWDSQKKVSAPLHPHSPCAATLFWHAVPGGAECKLSSDSCTYAINTIVQPSYPQPRALGEPAFTSSGQQSVCRKGQVSGHMSVVKISEKMPKSYWKSIGTNYLTDPFCSSMPCPKIEILNMQDSVLLRCGLFLLKMKERKEKTQWHCFPLSLVNFLVYIFP